MRTEPSFFHIAKLSGNMRTELCEQRLNGISEQDSQEIGEQSQKSKNGQTLRGNTSTKPARNKRAELERYMQTEPERNTQAELEGIRPIFRSREHMLFGVQFTARFT